MIQPLGKHVLVEPIEESSSIILPEISKGQAEKGIVRGVGSAVEDRDLEEGKTVIFRKYSPEEFDHDGKKVYIIEEADLMGIEV